MVSKKSNHCNFHDWVRWKDAPTGIDGHVKKKKMKVPCKETLNDKFHRSTLGDADTWEVTAGLILS